MNYCSKTVLVLGALVCLSCGEATQDSGATTPSVSVQPTLPIAVETSPDPAQQQIEGTEGAVTPPAETQLPILISPEPMAVIEEPAVEECVSAGVASQTRPVNLFLALDSSGSMGGRNVAQRWNPVTVALKAFLSDPASEGLNAALQVFPAPSAFQLSGRNIRAAMCRADSYQAADVPVQALPDKGDFSRLIDAHETMGVTPTNPMFQGVIQQAEGVLAADPAARAAIVMLSDGIPTICSSGDLTGTERSALTVAAVADRIPTYVIGVGENLDNLNAIAQAGGTGEALLIDPTDPEATRLQILSRLDEIRGAVASCEVTIPEPPVGKRLDPDKVFANIHNVNAPTIEVPYEPDCLTGTGFRYDDVDAPTSINLCEKACDALAQADATVEVVFGCEVNRQVAR